MSKLEPAPRRQTNAITTSRLRSLVLLLWRFPPTVAAQDTPRTEFFGGYSHLRLTQDSGLEPGDLNGWNTSAKLNATPRIGLLADFSADYGHRSLAPYQLFLPIPGNPNPVIRTEPGNIHQYTFSVGPEIRIVHHGRLTVNARALVGMAKTNTLILPLTVPIQLPFGPNGEPVTFSRRTIAGGTGFAGSLGGGLDNRISDHLSYRIVQPELLVVNFIGLTSINMRISTGIVFTSGKAISPEPSVRRVSLGLVAGGSLTDDVGQESSATFAIPGGALETEHSRFFSTHKDYIVGAMVEFGLPWRMALEIDGLYRPMNFTFAAVLPNEPLNSVSPNTIVTWEFPVLAKYRFPMRKVKPLIEAGPSFRSSGNLNGTAPSSYGGTFGLGVEVHAWKLKIAPVIRYTHWAGEGRYEPHTKPNQVEALVGISY